MYFLLLLAVHELHGRSIWWFPIMIKSVEKNQKIAKSVKNSKISKLRLKIWRNAYHFLNSVLLRKNLWCWQPWNCVFLLFITSYQSILSVCWCASVCSKQLQQLHREVKSSFSFWLLRTHLLGFQRSSCKPRYSPTVFVLTKL